MINLSSATELITKLNETLSKFKILRKLSESYPIYHNFINLTEINQKEAECYAAIASLSVVIVQNDIEVNQQHLSIGFDAIERGLSLLMGLSSMESLHGDLLTTKADLLLLQNNQTEAMLTLEKAEKLYQKIHDEGKIIKIKQKIVENSKSSIQMIENHKDSQYTSIMKSLGYSNESILTETDLKKLTMAFNEFPEVTNDEIKQIMLQIKGNEKKTMKDFEAWWTNAPFELLPNCH